MKLEISVEGQEPLIHKIKSQNTMIGSGSDCEIVLHADGISRKHAAIHSENDQYFVIDQGSTNGSFINEERLTPGSKAQFTTFFPVKLGFHVTITLMDDDDADSGGGFSFADTLKKPEPSIKKSSSAPQAKTKTASVGSKTSTSNLELSSAKSKKGPAANKRPTKVTKTEDDKKMGNSKLFAFLLIAASVGYFFWDKKQTEVALVAAQPPKIEDQVKKVEAQLVQQSYESESPKGVEAASNGANIMKCSFPMEKKACLLMQLPDKSYSITGMVLTANAYVFVLPALRQEGKTFDTFRGERGWDWNLRPYMDSRLDNRDVAALYFVRGGPDLWKDITEDDKRDWVYVVFVNPQGARVEEMLFTKADALIEIMTSPEFAVSKEMSTSVGLVPLDIISGLFRRAPE